VSAAAVAAAAAAPAGAGLRPLTTKHLPSPGWPMHEGRLLMLGVKVPTLWQLQNKGLGYTEPCIMIQLPDGQTALP